MIVDLGVTVKSEFLDDFSQKLESSAVDTAAVYIEHSSRLDWVAKEKFLPNLVLIQQVCTGKELVDFDVKDGVKLVWSSIGSSSMIRRVMELTRFYNFRVSFLPRDCSLVAPGGMHESEVGYSHGLGFDPELSETVEVARLLEIADYTSAKLHLRSISSARSCELIEDAKKRGVDVTADTTITHLLYSEEDLSVDAVELKVTPPVRTIKDKEALVSAVKSSVIDVVSTGHCVLQSGDKLRTFYEAESGRDILGGIEKELTKLESMFTKKRLSEAVNTKPRELLFG